MACACYFIKISFPFINIPHFSISAEAWFTCNSIIRHQTMLVNYKMTVIDNCVDKVVVLRAFVPNERKTPAP